MCVPVLPVTLVAILALAALGMFAQEASALDDRNLTRKVTFVGVLLLSEGREAPAGGEGPLAPISEGRYRL